MRLTPIRLFFKVRQIFDLLGRDDVVSKRVDQSHNDRFAGPGRIRYNRRRSRVVGNADFARGQRLRGKAAALDEKDFNFQTVFLKKPFLFRYPEKRGAGTHGRVAQANLFLSRAQDCESDHDRTRQNDKKEFRTKSLKSCWHASILPFNRV